jgi:hypothetical protein
VDPVEDRRGAATSLRWCLLSAASSP